MITPPQQWNPNWWVPQQTINQFGDYFAKQGFQTSQPATPQPSATRPPLAGLTNTWQDFNAPRQTLPAGNPAQAAIAQEQARMAPYRAQMEQYRKQMEQWGAKQRSTAGLTPLGGLTQQQPIAQPTAQPRYEAYTGQRPWMNTSKPGVFR